MWDMLLFVGIINFFAAASPGPDFFMVMKNSLSYSKRIALITCFGIVAGIATHMSYCIAGIAVIIQTTPWLFTLLRYAGSAYLIWIGAKALLSRAKGTTYISQTERVTISDKKAFMQGYLCNLLNPKATMFFLAIFTQALASDSSLLDKFAVAMVIIVESLIWWPVVALTFQSELVRRRYYKLQFLVDKLLGVILIALGIKVALGV